MRGVEDVAPYSGGVAAYTSSTAGAAPAVPLPQREGQERGASFNYVKA